MKKPKEAGYYFPAEFAPHEATWLSWPHKEASWPGKIDAIYPNYSLFVKYLAESEKVRINIADPIMPVYHPGIVMEGGSVEFNGKGTLLTSTACLLNENRNPHLNQQQIESYLYQYYGVEQVLWVAEGIVGDDTDGHIDDTVRFVNEDTVITVVEENVHDENNALLQANLKQLRQMRLLNGKQLNIVELPMPDAVVYEDQRLPASYANFYISNKYVIVPVFNCAKDEKALQIIAGCFPERQVVGIDSTDIIWGLGSFHCLSQQEPLVLSQVIPAGIRRGIVNR